MNHTMDEFVSFARFVATAVVDEDFEDNAGAFAELFCRRLRSLGIVTDDDKNWNYTPTNADYIRAMTDKQLAAWLGGHITCVRCPVKHRVVEESCCEAWERWLKEEVKTKHD